MKKQFAIADLHIFHNNILTFKNDDGSPLRDFKTIDDMHEYMKNRWNSVVSPEDRVYLLGDIDMNKKGKNLWFLDHLNGRKVLVKGNHDIAPLNKYLPYFDDIRAYVVKKGFIMSHVPIHEESLARWSYNIHGHLHSRSVMKGNKKDQRYICVSVEQVDYTPVDLQPIIDKINGKFVA